MPQEPGPPATADPTGPEDAEGPTEPDEPEAPGEPAAPEDVNAGDPAVGVGVVLGEHAATTTARRYAHAPDRNLTA